MRTVSKRDVILEVQSMLGCGWQKAKTIVALADAAPGTLKRVNNSRPREYMTQTLAAKHVDAAKERIRLVDEDEPAANNMSAARVMVHRDDGVTEMVRGKVMEGPPGVPVRCVDCGDGFFVDEHDSRLPDGPFACGCTTPETPSGG